MRIVFAEISTGLTGGNRYVFEVANRLKARGHDVKIASLVGDHRWFKEVDVEVIYKQPSRRTRAAAVAYRLYKAYSLLKHGAGRARGVRPYEALSVVSRWLGVRPDFVYDLAELLQELDSDATVATYYLTAFSVWFSDRSGKRLYLMQDFPELVEDNEGAVGVKMFRLSLRLPFHFVTVSSYMKQLILEENPSAKVTIARPGVNHEVFRPRQGVVDARGKKKVMVIFRGSKYKGDEVAVRVLNEVSRKIPLHAILVGSKKLVSKYSRTLGFDFSYSLFSGVDDETLAKLYSSADAFLFTSYAEGFGSPPLEAMACGTPVVMTDSRGPRDYAIDGYNALISQPGDVKSLAENLLRVLQDGKLRETLIENGLETARRFTWDSTAERFEGALKEE
mgnify:CR=1 FL=1